MKFGGIHLMGLPRPWTSESERTLLNDALDIAELSDQCGFDYVWATEHHFLEEYSHASAPEIFLAACSQRTKNIRLAHGIIQTPPQINHPARVAERIAALDLISNGRCEFGMGSGATTTELGGFLVPQEEKKAMQLEGMRVAVRMLVEDPFTGFEGKYVKVPPRNLVPKPLQKPHPPLWMACSRRESIIDAARLGLGALTFSFVTAAEARQWVKDYYATMENECEPLGYAVNPSFAIEPRFVNYILTTKDGRMYDGVIANETPGSITLRGGSEDGDETVLRQNVSEIRASSVSLMPEDLEKSLSKQDLADVIAYLRGGL